MWKDRRSTGHDMTKSVSEEAINQRDKTIRGMIDELVKGTRELRAAYMGENVEPTDPA